MKARLPCAAVLALSALAPCSCGNDAAGDGAQVRSVAENLLAVHHLLGRQPEQLSQEEHEAEVDPAALDALVADRGAFDPFIGDLYVGFVVGALARHQGRWVTAVDGDRATIAAGDARVAFSRKGGAWKIDLSASIPDVIKTRAAAEKKRYDAARTAGDALGRQ